MSISAWKGSKNKTDSLSRPATEPVVHAEACDIHRDLRIIANMSEGKHEGIGTELHVQILDSGRPILRKAPLQATASRPSLASAGGLLDGAGRRLGVCPLDLRSGHLFVGPGNATRAE